MKKECLANVNWFKRTVLLSMLCLAFGLQAFSQERVVTGVVTSADDGLGMPGVSVVIKGSTVGTSTNIEGQYTLKVTGEGKVLIFSFVGMTTQEVAVSSNVINVIMDTDSEQMEEVVVTALGIKREAKKLGYAMTEVDGDELAAANTVNPVLALQGKSAGVSIGASDGGLFGSAKIQIRGVSVLNSNNNQPIFVIDGVIIENSVANASADWSADANDFGNQLKNLNPDDYESVSVLKGAAATALYGSRGINGAVIIKTKDGSGTKGIGVTVKQSIGIDHVYKQPGIQYQYGPGALSGYTGYGEKDADGNYYRFSNEQFYTNDDGVPVMNGHPWEWAGYGPEFDGREIIGYDGEKTTYSPAKDNLKDVYDLGVSSNSSVILKGGNEKGNFYLSNSYNHRNGTLPSNTFERNSLLFSGSYKLASWLTARASISITNSNSKNPASSVSQRFMSGDWANWYDTDKYKDRKYWQAEHGGVPSNNYGDDFANVPGKNVWFGYNMNNKGSKEQVTRPVVRLTADLTDWLSVTAEGNMNYYSRKYENKELGQGYANEGGYYEIQHNIDESKTGKIVINMNKNINEDISTNVMLGGEIWEQEKSYTRVNTDGGLIVPGRFYLGNSKKTLQSAGGVSGTKQINSMYFLASVGYKEQVFLDITGRNDWSSSLVYTDGTGSNSFFYPSVSASWLFDETFDMPAWMTFGKVRMSWAQVGNDTDPYSINQGYSIGKYEMNNGSFVYNNAVSTTLVDRGIKPEKKNSFEIGADVRFFNNRLGLDVAYYDETIKKQIGKIGLPQVSGYGSLLTNIGTLTNSGLEITLTATPIRTRDFKWNATFNYWNNKTKVKDLHDNYGEYKNLGGSVAYGNFRVGSVAFEDGDYGVLMSDSKPKEWQSLDANGNEIDDPRNGMKVFQWSDSRRGAYYQRSGKVEKVGKINPDFEGSLDNTFTYKGLTVSVLLDARFGGHIASYSNKYGTAYGWLNTSLKGRSPEHGGVEWTSKYGDTNGQSFGDGVIPDGVFEAGQMVTAPDGSSVDVGGMTYQEAYDQGFVEPTHASFHNYFTNSWGQGVVNNDWFNEVRYIALRNISLGYNLPKAWAQKIGAQNVYTSVNARNLGYLYNSLPNNLNPESFRGTSSTETFRERSFSPYTASYTFTVAVDF